MEVHGPLGNPLLDAFAAMTADERTDPAVRDSFVGRYAFAIPNAAALDAVVESSRDGVVEIGAGTGYWARLLHDRGISVRAYDLAPAPSEENTWFAGAPLWFHVSTGDETVAVDAAPATLLLVWPTRNETWAMDAARRHHEAGGSRLVYVGEAPGGRTGDDGLHAILGELPACAQCRYGALTAACTCDVPRLWHRVREVAIPTWPGFTDSLRVYARHDANERRPWYRSRRRRLS